MTARSKRSPKATTTPQETTTGTDQSAVDQSALDQSALDQSALGRFVKLVGERGATVATAESLTGGLIGAALTDIPGISAIYRGGVIVYATDLKVTLAGVPADRLAADGPVHAKTALAMATGVRERLGATYGLATTGVAGPEPQDGIQAGTVYVAVAGPDEVKVQRLALAGDRQAVRQGSVEAVLALAVELLEEEPGPSGG
jgi:nicotinamide-nucleotide amidase